MHVQLWQRTGSREWQRQQEALTCSEAKLSERFMALHGQRAHHKLYDFDDHLNDISR